MRVSIVKFRNVDMDLMIRLQQLMVGLNGNLNKAKIEELTNLLEKDFNDLLKQKKESIVRKIIHEWKNQMSSVPNRNYPFDEVNYFSGKLNSINYEDFLAFFNDRDNNQSDEKRYEISIGILAIKIKYGNINFEMIPDQIFNYDSSITLREIQLIKIMILDEVKQIIKP